MNMRSAKAFTFIEVLCVLLVVVVGVGGVVALVAYGMEVASRARGETTGLATAISIAKDADPRPLLAPELQGDWTPPTPIAPTTSVDLSHAGDLKFESKGFINGFYVVRTETSTYPTDVLAASGGVVYARSCRVEVNVYETFNGRPVTAYVTRLVRQRGRP